MCAVPYSNTWRVRRPGSCSGDTAALTWAMTVICQLQDVFRIFFFFFVLDHSGLLFKGKETDIKLSIIIIIVDEANIEMEDMKRHSPTRTLR